MTALDYFFAPDGALARVVRNYQHRAGQLEMAKAIALAIAQKQHLIAEAGTGTGKTFAYLVPAILSGKKVIISTGTKNLQDQLFHHDLPTLRKALKQPFDAQLLKGRSNYLCTLRLDAAVHSSFGFSKDDALALGKINRWAKRTETGDIAEMSEVAETHSAWYQATSTIENCLGTDCDDYSTCFLVKARKRAQEADVLVVNHHLLCADWSLRDDGGELLPNADAIIIDEAHQLADVASNFLGITISSKQLEDFTRDSLSEFYADATDIPALRTACEGMDKVLKDLRLAFGLDNKRGDWQDILNSPAIVFALAQLKTQLQRINIQLAAASVKSKALELCFQRGTLIETQLNAICDENSQQSIHWYETFKHGLSLNRTPLDIASEFQKFMQQHQTAWIFTSATLSVANRFDHFAGHLGLADASGLCWDSPFDYAQQALFYHPKGLPDPSTPDFIAQIVEFALPVLQASRGRAFFLFTSHRALQQAAALLEDRLDYPLLIQGSRAKARLLSDFQQAGNAVLLGTASFWEGVDVRGEALSCVIIDKLPFASPGDPVLKARLDAMTRQGQNSFYDYQVPNAVIALRQGIGRLIRDTSDRGVLMICDPRLLKKSYGQLFLDSIPPMRRTRELSEVQAFFEF